MPQNITNFPPSYNLTKEQNKAMAILEDNWPMKHSLMINNFVSDNVITGFCGYIGQYITYYDLPCNIFKCNPASTSTPLSSTWRQSSTKNTIVAFLDEQVYTIVLIKFRTTTEVQKPGCKLWIYHIYQEYNNEIQFITTFIFCERGVVSQNSLNINDLCFLKEFMDPKTFDTIFA